MRVMIDDAKTYILAIYKNEYVQVFYVVQYIKVALKVCAFILMDLHIICTTILLNESSTCSSLLFSFSFLLDT